MIRGLDSANELFLADVERIQQRIERAQLEITSGRRILTVSDDPDQISRLLQARADLQQAKQIQVDLGRIQLETDTAETALAAAVSAVERAQTLASSATSTNQTAESRRSLAAEVQVVLEQLVGISRTAVDGRYIFSGDSDQTPPYAIDLLQPNGVGLYAGSPATRQTRDASGQLFNVSRPANQIFEDPAPANNVFGAVNALRVALEANDEAGVIAAMENLATAHSHLNVQLSFYGASQKRVEQAVSAASTLELRLRERISEIEDADVTAAAAELTTLQIHQEAAFAAKAAAPRKSLFDYLG